MYMREISSNITHNVPRTLLLHPVHSIRYWARFTVGVQQVVRHGETSMLIPFSVRRFPLKSEDVPRFPASRTLSPTGG